MFPPANHRILYVDDEPALLEIAKLFLEQTDGISVDTTTDPLEACEMIMTGQYDAVVSDYQMPEMDGIVLLKRIREAGSLIPFIIFTGRGREEVVIEALNNGADSYLQKGGDPRSQFAELANTIQQLAGKQEVEVALRKSEEMLHRAESLAHLGSWALDRETGHLTWSDETYRIFGIDPEGTAMTYEAFLSMIHPADRALVDAAYSTSITEGKDFYTVEHRIIRADTGEVRYVVERCEHTRDDSGQVFYSIGMVHDITERKLAQLELLQRHEELQAAYEQLTSIEEELRTGFDDLAESQHKLQESERKLADIIDFLPDATFVLDTGGRIIAWNRAIERMTGIPKAKMLGRGDYAHAVPFYGEARPILIDHVLESSGMKDCPYDITTKNGESLEGETDLARPGGREATLMVRASPLYDREGRCAGAIEIVRDITVQKQAEANLRETKDYLERLIDHANAPIAVWNPDGTLTRFNKAFERLTGIPADEAIGQNHEFLFPVESRDASIELIRRAMAGEFWEDMVIPILCRSGEVRTVLWNSANITGSDGKTLISTIVQGQDITARKQAAAELQQKHEELQTAYEQLTSIEEDLRKSFDDLARSQRQLKESEELYRRISESMSDAVYVCDVRDTGESAISMVTGAVHEITGYTTEEILSMQCCRNLLHPDDLSVFEREVLSLTPDKSTMIEVRMIRRDGLIRWIRFSANHLTNPDGSIRFYGGWQDVTERKMAEDALRESEQHFRTLADGGKAMIRTCGMDLACDYFNKPWLAFTGRTLEDECGDGWTEGVHPADLAGCIETYTDSFFQREPYSMVYRLRRHDGEYRWILDDGSPRYDANENFIGFIGYCLDVTDMREMKEALQDTAEKMESIFRAAPAGIGMLVDETITEVNDLLCEITGYTRDELIGRPFQQIYSGKTEYAAAYEGMDDQIKRAGKYMFETRLMRKDGTSSDVQVAITPIDPGDHSQGMAFTMLDITESKAMEQEIEYHSGELLRQTNSLAVANKKLNLMNSITRHDVLNQLTILLGNLWIAQEAEPGEDIGEYLARVKNAADKIQRQIEFTRDYTDLGVRSPEWQRISSAIRSAAMHELPIDDESGDLAVYADPMLSRVFANLMDNTLRHGESATRIRVRYRLEEDGDLTLIWEDDGAGVPAEEKSRIFNRGVGKNTGLGLFLIREILGITGISIAETGEPGKGARFEIRVSHGMYRVDG